MCSVEGLGPSPDGDSFELFVLANVKYPDTSRLLPAFETPDGALRGRYMHRMDADGSRSYLKTATKNDARTFSVSLARAGGSRKWEFPPTDSSALVGEAGKLALSAFEELRLATRVFRRRCSVPAAIHPALLNRNPNYVPPPSFRRHITAFFCAISQPEWMAAASSLTSGRAPGPDAIPAGALKNVSLLHPYPLAMVNAVCCSGYIP